MLIIDASPIIAIAFREKHIDWAIDQLNSHASELKMSTINATEVLLKFYTRAPHNFRLFEDILFKANIEFIPPTIEVATRAAEIRVKYHINLGDSFVVALAELKKGSIITIDSDFKKIRHLDVIMPPL